MYSKTILISFVLIFSNIVFARHITLITMNDLPNIQLRFQNQNKVYKIVDQDLHSRIVFNIDSSLAKKDHTLTSIELKTDETGFSSKKIVVKEDLNFNENSIQTIKCKNKSDGLFCNGEIKVGRNNQALIQVDII